MSKAKRGDKLRIQARDWNRLLDKANQFGNQSTGGANRKSDGEVWVKNTLGRDLVRWSAVMIDPFAVQINELNLSIVR